MPKLLIPGFQQRAMAPHFLLHGRNPSVTGGDRASVVLSEPLNGGSPEVRVTGPERRQERFREDSLSGVNPSKVPPHGFSENRTGPAADHLTTLD